MGVSQSLSVTEVSGSQSVSNNTSKVRILWQSTQSGGSWNGYTRTAKYWVSKNGGAETEYSVSYTLPKASTKTIVDTTITVAHKADGTGTVKVRTWMDTNISEGIVEKSKEITLSTITRASEISSVADLTLGNSCSVKWTPMSTAFRYKLKFSLGDWSYTTGAIHPKTTALYAYTGYKIPVSVANQITKSKTGEMTVTLYSYSDSGATKQIGSSSSATFTVTVPSAPPTVTMTLSAVSSLPAAFSGLYIQGKTKVKAALTATGQYGTGIKSYSMKVDGKSYDTSANYTSGYLAKSGSVAVTGYATDSRGYTGSVNESITVIAYSNPQILPVAGESEVVAARCDSKGNLADNGTYLKIKCKRRYSSVNSKNFCQIRYRYKLKSASSWSGWTTILSKDSLGSDEIISGALLGGVLDVASSYLVQIQAVDDVGGRAETTIHIPTDTVYCHRKKNGMGLGKYCEGENLLDVAWDAHFRGEVRVGDKTLKEFILSVISEGG